MQQNKIKSWLETARLRTLPLAFASIFTGSALAYWNDKLNLLVALLCLLSALLLQILSNFANDFGDASKGSDTKDRIGPLRAIQKGEITYTELKSSFIKLIIVNIIVGGVLVMVATKTWLDLLAFLILGGLAIIASITYTVGKKPYGYMGLGDLSVFIFFGLLAVGGTYYLQANALDFKVVFLPAIGCGLLAMAVLNINNLRDFNQDKASGKNTLIVKLGTKFGRIYHCALIGIASLCYLFFAIEHFHFLISFLFVLMLPLLLKHAYFVLKNKDLMKLRPLLAQMAAFSLITNILFSIGLIIG